MEPNLRRGCRFDEYSEVCDAGNAGWGTKPETTLFLLTDLASLLNDPNTSSPANVEASNLYKDSRKEYHKRVRETVEKSWDD